MPLPAVLRRNTRNTSRVLRSTGDVHRRDRAAGARQHRDAWINIVKMQGQIYERFVSTFLTNASRARGAAQNWKGQAESTRAALGRLGTRNAQRFITDSGRATMAANWALAIPSGSQRSQAKSCVLNGSRMAELLQHVATDPHLARHLAMGGPMAIDCAGNCVRVSKRCSHPHPTVVGLFGSSPP